MQKYEEQIVAAEKKLTQISDTATGYATAARTKVMGSSSSDSKKAE